jgi:uncharacterized protein (TIGR00725 family)
MPHRDEDIRMRRIGVIGSSACSEEVLAVAEQVGRAIAKRNAVLVCGGLGGVMEAAARGARQAGGITVGIIPGTRGAEANPFIDIPIVTGIGIARNSVVVRSSEVIIALHGGYGTLSEIAYALQLKVPVVGLHTWEVSPEITKALDPEDAVQKAFALLGD